MQKRPVNSKTQCHRLGLFESLAFVNVTSYKEDIIFTEVPSV